ncbi:MAG: tryptophan 2,3-dioxygenase family protein [Chloroflexi bacterium]|nr:tryptophan 2,3-dioxygenase family protein [Chloroflexota bacterium]
MPRLLTLQPQDSPSDLLLVTIFQWYELWFKVLVTDMRAALEDAGRSFQSIKLLRRGSEILQLLDLQAAFAEALFVRELWAAKSLYKLPEHGYSDQLAQLSESMSRLSTLETPDARLREAMRDYDARFEVFRAHWQKLVQATLSPRASQAPSYAEWLRLTELLDLQQGAKAAWTEAGQHPAALMQPEYISPDENMFIVVHQCFELWFKVILDHVDRAIEFISQDEIAEATRLLRRVVQIQRLLNWQIQMPATMLPMDFALFREQQMERDGKTLITGLAPASGTESYQFREIEVACGLAHDPAFRKYLNETEKLPIRLLTPRQSGRLNQPTLGDVFDSAVARRGVTDLAMLFAPANVWNPNRDLADLADALVDFDEAFRMWRIIHVNMVEKMIGGKSGTGFLGPEYLMETAGLRTQSKGRILEDVQRRPRFFEELWAVRTRLSAY